jgi:hypothetical protein
VGWGIKMENKTTKNKSIINGFNFAKQVNNINSFGDNSIEKVLLEGELIEELNKLKSVEELKQVAETSPGSFLRMLELDNVKDLVKGDYDMLAEIAIESSQTQNEIGRNKDGRTHYINDTLTELAKNHIDLFGFEVVKKIYSCNDENLRAFENDKKGSYERMREIINELPIKRIIRDAFKNAKRVSLNDILEKLGHTKETHGKSKGMGN